MIPDAQQRLADAIAQDMVRLEKLLKRSQAGETGLQQQMNQLHRLIKERQTGAEPKHTPGKLQ